MNPNPASSAPETYTPGYAKPKLAMCLAGLLLFLLGASQLALPVRLLLSGGKARAEAVRVVKAKEGAAPRVLTSDLQIEAARESRDRSYTFWNEYRFRTGDGRDVEVRSPIGSQLKPLEPLIDDDGLPTGALVYYDRAHPETVVFPLVGSTWFVPGVLMLVGAICASIGACLRYYANKPIELPRL